jgi:Tannase and feruloyl esterase
VKVPDNASCTLNFVNVTGNVQAGHGSTLLITAYTEPSMIGGNVQADQCKSALLQGNVTVGGNVQIQQCTGAGPNGFQGPDIVIKGNFQCQGNSSNAASCLAWLGKVQGDVQIQQNTSVTASDVSLVDIGGNLHCESNAPTPTHMHGPDWVNGQENGRGPDAEHQCAGFSTTKTSIGTPVTPAASCASLATLSAAGFPVPNTVITSAVDTPATATLPERCIINGYINRHVSPVDNCTYQNGFQVQLPLPAAWNGRFMFEGGGGTEGSVPAATGTDSGSAGSNFGIDNGYAVASQDGGHENSQLTACGKTTLAFYLDPMGAIGNGYQSIELATLTAKYLINQYYGDGPARSYWVGCSEGGRQGMVMSEVFPSFFDGIVAGDPVYDVEAVNLSEIWSMQQILNAYKAAQPPLPPITEVSEPPPQAPEPILYPGFPLSDQSLMEAALLQACDALDGVADGVIDNLPECWAKFDPASATYTDYAGAFGPPGTIYPLQCPGAKNATCLSSAQIQAVKNINQGARASNGAVIHAPAGAVAKNHVDNIVFGYAYDGGFFSTVGIPSRNIGSPTSPPGNEGQVAQVPYLSLSPPNLAFDPLSFNFDTDLGMLTKATPKIEYSTSLDISKYVRYGHKIIWYHGLTDPGPPVLGTIKYYNEMAQQFGGLEAAQSFSRFYPVPNLDHCTGGATTDQFDMLTPLVKWVENDSAPGSVDATGVNFNATTYQVGFVSGQPDNAPTTRTRPLCPYPQQARFAGPRTVVNGVPVALNPSDLADSVNYTCIRPPRDHDR